MLHAQEYPVYGVGVPIAPLKDIEHLWQASAVPSTPHGPKPLITIAPGDPYQVRIIVRQSTFDHHASPVTIGADSEGKINSKKHDKFAISHNQLSELGMPFLPRLRQQDLAALSVEAVARVVKPRSYSPRSSGST